VRGGARAPAGGRAASTSSGSGSGGSGTADSSAAATLTLAAGAPGWRSPAVANGHSGCEVGSLLDDEDAEHGRRQDGQPRPDALGPPEHGA
jgi:hypothetical protein